MVRFFPVRMLGFITLSLITTPPVHCNVTGRNAVVTLLPCKPFLPVTATNVTAPCYHKPMAADSGHSQPAAPQQHRRIILPAPIDPSINCTTLRALSKRGGNGGGDRRKYHNHKKIGMTLKNAEVGRNNRRFVAANKKKHPRRRQSSSQVLSS